MHKKITIYFLSLFTLCFYSAKSNAEPIEANIIDLIVSPSIFENKEIEVRCNVSIDPVSGFDKSYCLDNSHTTIYVWIDNRKIKDKNEFRWLLKNCARGMLGGDNPRCKYLIINGIYRDGKIEDAELIGAK
jgi:hypothetical protein